MATFSLPRGRFIEVTANVNADWPQRVVITGPSVDVDWEGSGEGKRIGQTTLQFPQHPVEEVPVQVALFHKKGEGDWVPSFERFSHDRGKGEILISAEDGGQTLDTNDAIVRFRWVV